jgi:hypothetical protein
MTDSICEIDSRGTKHWRNKEGKFHRLDGPAIEYPDGTKLWFMYGSYHRLDGPAIEFADGDREWYIKGKKLTQQQFDQHPLVIFYRLSKDNV